MLKYVIGIDSGGTKYRVLAEDLAGNKLGEFTGITGSRYFVEHNEMLRRINFNIDACLETFGGSRGDCAYILCGTTGLDSEEDRLYLNGVYQNLPGFTCPVECINDAELAHYTVTGGYGALVISGTGSIAFGRNKKNETARVGGWLFAIMGDEGSGAWVSKHALRQLGRWFNKAVPDGPMFRLLREELKIHSPKELMDYASRIATPPWQSPRLSHLVNQAANEGDEIARHIITAAAAETFSLVRDLVTVLDLEAEGEFNIGIWGSNIINSDLHQEEFRKLAAEHYPGGKILLPHSNATEGATKLARTRLASVNH